MKEFYLQTYWLWVVSKIILSLLLLISALSIIAEGGLQPLELLVNTLGVIEGILLLVTLLHDFSSNPDFNLNILKTITGFTLSLFGLALAIVLLSISKGSQSEFYSLGFPLAGWMLLVGIFDLHRINRHKKTGTI